MQPCHLNHCNSCHSNCVIVTVLSSLLQGMLDILKNKAFAFRFSLLQKTPKIKSTHCCYTKCTNVLPYPAEPGSVPGHILHASLKQKTKSQMKRSAKLFSQRSAWAESKKSCSDCTRLNPNRFLVSNRPTLKRRCCSKTRDYLLLGWMDKSKKWQSSLRVSCL